MNLKDLNWVCMTLTYYKPDKIGAKVCGRVLSFDPDHGGKPFGDDDAGGCGHLSLQTKIPGQVCVVTLDKSQLRDRLAMLAPQRGDYIAVKFTEYKKGKKGEYKFFEVWQGFPPATEEREDE